MSGLFEDHNGQLLAAAPPTGRAVPVQRRRDPGQSGRHSARDQGQRPPGRLGLVELFQTTESTPFGSDVQQVSAEVRARHRRHPRPQLHRAERLERPIALSDDISGNLWLGTQWAGVSHTECIGMTTASSVLDVFEDDGRAAAFEATALGLASGGGVRGSVGKPEEPSRQNRLVFSMAGVLRHLRPQGRSA